MRGVGRVRVNIRTEEGERERGRGQRGSEGKGTDTARNVASFVKLQPGSLFIATRHLLLEVLL